MTMQKAIWTMCCALMLVSPLSAQTISEKKAGLQKGTAGLNPELQELLARVNQEHILKSDDLRKLYAQANLLNRENASPAAFRSLLRQINAVKQDLAAIDEQWREAAAGSNKDEGYALWQQPDTTLEQLVIDYGSQDYVYLIPDEIGAIKLSVTSNLPIPRSAWDEMLELILTQNGVGIRQLNPYLRELYFLQPTGRGGIKVVTNRKEDLALLPTDMRVAFILTPEASEARRMWFFLDKFVNHETTALQLVGRDVLIIAKVGEVLDLLKLADFVASNKGEKEYKLVPLASVDAEQMAQILQSIFGYGADMPPPGSTGQIPIRNFNAQVEGSAPTQYAPPPPPIEEGNGLRVVVLANLSQALFLVGTKSEVTKAEEIIHEVESQLGDVRQKVIFWYTVKNSDAETLASILDKVYALMVHENVGREGPNGAPPPPGGPLGIPLPAAEIYGPLVEPPPAPPSNQQLYHDAFYQDGQVAINPTPIVSTGELPPVVVNQNRNNFIVDPTTNGIVMVVEAEFLPKLKDLIKKLDVPKKMVRIEVLLVERRITDEVDYGLNSLRVGSAAKNVRSTSIFWDGTPGTPADGIFDFMISRMRGDGWPAFDLSYRFLLSQDNVHINSNPSVTTLNQTPASIIVQEEISINTGVFEVETAKGVTLKDAFTRAQYGINIQVTPTIHIRQWCDEENPIIYDDEFDYITLETKVNFDTFARGGNPQQPDVQRRQIENIVLIPDGQTVILGGLRTKNIDDSRVAIPFIGELPGIGKLFSYTTMADASVEMFIFITPKIIYDPIEDQERILRAEMMRRPGDIPAFMCCLEYAREQEKFRAMAGTMQILFGRPPERCLVPVDGYECLGEYIGEYDGR